MLSKQMRSLQAANTMKRCLAPSQSRGYFSLMDRMKEKI